MLQYNHIPGIQIGVHKGGRDLYSSSGKNFLDYIEKEKLNGKTLEDIALENNKTKEAVRSKIKRERKKILDIDGIKTITAVKMESMKEKPNKIKEKSKAITNKIDIQNIDNKLEFIINLLENSKQKNNEVQNVGQALQIDVQLKREYVKTSMRVECEIWREFLEFAKSKNKEFKQQDLISLALKEFLDKYK